ncbi:MIF-like protein mif-2 [Diadema setosum]|uniref:MIF-like protein mif-2 n=1 Tax=Diadema setosum TaxID=31175 RepID=UPI003B3B6E7F
MPVFQLVTNVPRENIPDGFTERAADIVAEQLGTPRKAAVVMIRHQSIFRDGSDASRIVIRLACVDAFNDHVKNRTYSKAIIDFASKELGVPHDRIVMTMENQSPWEIGIPGGRLLGDRMRDAK